MRAKNLSILFAALFVIAGAVLATGARAEGEVPAPPAIGATIEDFTLPDVDNKDRSLKSLAGKNGTVLLFIAVQCPVSNAYNERMEKLAEDYKAKGINVVGVNSNVTESAETVMQHSALTFKFPVLVDNKGMLAEKLGASHTPEVYFLDAKNVLVYHGAIDNDRSGRNVTENYLKSAFDASLAGKKIDRTYVEAFGCSIKRSAD